MKKILAFLVIAVICFSFTVIPASAAVPTALTIKETKTAPNINDGGKIDSVYGTKVFDLKASDHPTDSYNLYPCTVDGRDGEKLKLKDVKDAIKVMRNVGYMTYDNENLYIACEVTDIAPKASSNSEKYWNSTNLQILMFINDERCYPTIAYEGKNKVKVWGDDRSVLDYEAMECTFTEKSVSNYVYEIKIPWNAVPEVNSAADVKTFTMGMIQSSMANDAYVCSAFGEAYALDASRTIPVTMVAAKEESTSSKPSTSKPTTSSNTSSTQSNNSSVISSNAPTVGTDIVTSSEQTQSTEDNSSTATESTTVITEESEKDWTPIIIIGVIAAVVIIGGVVFIIISNKKS